MSRPPVPVRFAGFGALLLALALACGGDDQASSGASSGASTPQASSLGELLGDATTPSADGEASSGSAASEAPAPTPVLPQPSSADATTAEGPAPTEPEVEDQGEATSGETEACRQAREELQARRAEVDEARARDVKPLEERMTQARVRYERCIKAGEACTQDYERVTSLHDAAERAEQRYQAELQQIAELEAALYPYVQAVDRACGRR